jgi:hypothetical protein
MNTLYYKCQSSEAHKQTMIRMRGKYGGASLNRCKLGFRIALRFVLFNFFLWGGLCVGSHYHKTSQFEWFDRVQEEQVKFCLVD